MVSIANHADDLDVSWILRAPIAKSAANRVFGAAKILTRKAGVHDGDLCLARHILVGEVSSGE